MTAWSTRTITGTSCMTSAMRRTALVPAASSGAMTADASRSTTSVTPTGTVTMEKTSRVVQVRWHNSMGRQDSIGVPPLPGYLSMKGISSSNARVCPNVSNFVVFSLNAERSCASFIKSQGSASEIFIILFYFGKLSFCVSEFGCSSLQFSNAQFLECA